MLPPSPRDKQKDSLNYPFYLTSSLKLSTFSTSPQAIGRLRPTTRQPYSKPSHPLPMPSQTPPIDPMKPKRQTDEIFKSSFLLQPPNLPYPSITPPPKPTLHPILHPPILTSTRGTTPVNTLTSPPFDTAHSNCPHQHPQPPKSSTADSDP